MLGLAFIGRKPKNIKDLAVLLLIEEYPLKVKAIFNQLRQNYGVSATYQAVHKALLQLAEDGVVLRTKFGFIINREWIKKVEFFVALAKRNYQEQAEGYIHKIRNIQNQGDSTVITANSVYEALQAQRFVRSLFREKFFDTPPERRPIRVTHLYHIDTFILHMLDAHEGYLQNKYRFPHYYLVQGNSAVDEESAALVLNYPDLQKFEHFRLGIPLPRQCKLGVYDDLVLEVYYPKFILEAADKFYAQASYLANFDTINYFKEMIIKPARIKLILYKDRELADTIVKHTLTFFS